MEKNNNNFYYILAIIFLVVLMCTREHKYTKVLSNFKTTQKALEDTIKVTKNELGQSVGTTSVIQTSNPEDFLLLASKDSTIQKLQKLVKDNKKKLKGQGIAAVINSEGTIDITVPTVIDSTNKSSPIYKSEYKLRDKIDTTKVWAWGTTVARKDSTQVLLKYREEADLLIGEEKTGLLGLGKSKPFARITFKNPYNEVKEMKIYQKDLPKTKKFGIGPTISYGIGSGFEPQLFIGIGVSWDIIRL